MRTLSMISIRESLVSWHVPWRWAERRAWLFAITVVRIFVGFLVTLCCSVVSNWSRRWVAWVWNEWSLFRCLSPAFLVSLVPSVTLLVQVECRLFLGSVLSVKALCICLLVSYSGRVVYLMWRLVILLLIAPIWRMVLMMFGQKESWIRLILVASAMETLLQVARRVPSWVRACSIVFRFSMVFVSSRTLFSPRGPWFSIVVRSL